MQGNAVQAFGYLMRGAQMLNHRKLRPFVVIPLVINLIIFGSLVGYTLSTLNTYIEQFMSAIPDWLSFLRWIVWPLVGVTICLVTGYLFTAIALLIASPFNSLLAEKAEEIITGEEVESLEGIGAAIKDIPRSLLREVQKILYYLPLLLLVLVLSFVPAINFLAPLMWFALGAWMMSIQYLDYPMDNHKLPFKEVKYAARSKPVSSFGFGGGIALVTGIPVLNFFVVPAAVVGATLYWCEEFRTPPRR